MTTRSGTFEARIAAIDLLDDAGRPARAFTVGDHGRIHARVEFASAVADPTVGFLIRDRVGNDVFGTNSFHLAPIRGAFGPEDELLVEFDVGMNLGAGSYTLTVAVHSDATHVANNYDWWDKVIGFQMVPGPGSLFIGSAWLPVRMNAERHSRMSMSGHRSGAEPR